MKIQPGVLADQHYPFDSVGRHLLFRSTFSKKNLMPQATTRTGFLAFFVFPKMGHPKTDRCMSTAPLHPPSAEPLL